MRWWPVLAFLACTPPAEERATQNARAREAELLDSLKVTVQGGSIVERDPAESGGVHRVRVRAQSLDLRLEIASSGCEPETVLVEVSHLGDAAQVSLARRAFLDGLSSLVTAARGAAGGSVSLAGDADDPQRTPLEPSTAFSVAESDGLLVWTVVVDRGQLQLQTTPGVLPAVESAPGACVSLEPEQAGQLANSALVVRHRLTRPLPSAGFTFAVWGNNGGDGDVRERLLEAVAGEDLAFVVITGDLVGDGNTSSLRAAADTLNAGLGVPWFATVGDRDVRGTAATEYVDVLGSSSFAFDAGEVRVVLLDSADATLEPSQYAALDGWLADEPLWWASVPPPPRRLVLTHVPPISPYGTRRGAFKHRPDGARLIAQLVRAKVEALVTSHLAIFREQGVGSLNVIHSGGAGTPMETVSGDPHHWLRVRVDSDCLPSTGDACLQIEQVPIP